MPVIDLGAEQRRRIDSLMEQMYRNQPDDLSREIDRQAEEAVREANERRLERATQAQIMQGQERVRQGAERTRAYTSAEAAREAQEREQIERAKELSGRQERELQTRIPEWQAETEQHKAETDLARQHILQSRAEAGRIGAETEGLRQKQKREMDEALVQDSRNTVNFAIAQAQGGHQFTPDETKAVEFAFQHLSQDRFYNLPKNQDGTWQFDPKTVARDYPVMDNKGLPSTDFAKGIREINKARTPFAQKLQDYNDILKDPNSTEEQKRLAGLDVFKNAQPLMPQIEAGLVQRLLDAGEVDSGVNLMKWFQTKDGGNKPLDKPSASAMKDMNDRMGIIQTQNELRDMWHFIRQQNLYPTGAIRKPILMMLKEIGESNRYVDSFNKLLNTQVSQYMNLMHGKRFMEKEMEFIQNSLPSYMDSANVFETVLDSMQAHMIKDVRTRAGVMRSWGFRTPEGIDPIDPIDVLKRGEQLPGIESDNSYTPPGMSRDHALAIQKLSEIMQRRGQSVGGVGSFRGYQGGQLGETPAIPQDIPPEMTPPPGGDVTGMSDEDLAKERKRLSGSAVEQFLGEEKE